MTCPSNLTNKIPLSQRHPARPHPRRRQRLQPMERPLGALGAHAPARGARRVPLPEHPHQELPLGQWRQDLVVRFPLLPLLFEEQKKI